ncbi:hypothetical protein [Herbidospora sp. NBRC 101105]|uniref:hypothetical protein n=1 Tax=Herbidospora sp. NBRC 101105 TaxID=3032195 RepID=UPI0024A52CFF|nr:hypothetical protein [Herbidospora sp. NBRC 101105]GLX95021.1 hypothetical protein Hesp01_29710 [Herbidospora sp. NBRC 101105]
MGTPKEPFARLIRELAGLLLALVERAPAGESPIVVRERPHANVTRPVRRLTRPEGETTTRER